ncbi:MAG: DUF3987 domain-containing protein [Saprospiraceae bacterium]|nr:DUF3987 domain-containing protein [Saprospiraceae bacterium]
MNSIPHGADLENPPLPLVQKPPALSDEVFDNLPSLLKDACSVLEEQAEKEVFLVGALGVISGLLPNLRGFYDTQYYGCNLYCYILGAYGSGKGTLQLARRLGNEIHLKRKERSAKMLAQYKQDCIDAKENKLAEPEKPGDLMLFFPANNSKSGVVELLNNNGGTGILFENEGDTLADALKTDYGGFSDVLRKAFHHEPISFYRRTGSELREVETPHLSVILSSTPDQYQKLVPTIQNGLFSRFLHFFLTPCRDFKNVFNNSKRGYPEYFDELGKTFYKIHSYLETLSKPIEFELQVHQETRFLSTFSEWKKELGDMVSTDLDGTVNRLGLICFRLAMLFTALRHFGEADYPPTLVCTDTDFENALRIVEVLMRHALMVYYDLPRPRVSKDTLDFQNKLTEKADLFALCETLWRQGAKPLEIAKRTGIPKSTVYRFLNSLKR